MNNRNKVKNVSSQSSEEEEVTQTVMKYRKV